MGSGASVCGGLFQPFEAGHEVLDGGLGVVAGELEEGELQLQLRVAAAPDAAQSVAEGLD